MLHIIKCKSLPKTFYPDNITSHEGHVVNIRPAQAETNIMAKKMPHVQSAFTELTGQRKENIHI